MLKKRPAKERGHFDFGWLSTYHSFSFGEYYDPAHMGFRNLRVINDDVIAGGQGFGTHPHQNMEILTYVLEGELAHKDSMGNGSVIYPGDVQRMSAGTGVTHSEFNNSKSEASHLLQIWILPEKQGLAPSYEQKHFDADQKKNRLCLIASQKGEEASVVMHQDVKIYSSLLDESKKIDFKLNTQRYYWLQMVKGNLQANGVSLVKGDGLALEQEAALKLEASENSEFLLFDLA